MFLGVEVLVRKVRVLCALDFCTYSAHRYCLQPIIKSAPSAGICMKKNRHRRETNPNGGNMLITNVLCGRGMPASLPAGGVHRHREPNKSALSAEISVKKSSSARMKNHHQSEQYRFSINNIDALCLRYCYAIMHHMVTTNGTEKSVTKP